MKRDEHQTTDKEQCVKEEEKKKVRGPGDKREDKGEETSEAKRATRRVRESWAVNGGGYTRLDGGVEKCLDWGVLYTK